MVISTCGEWAKSRVVGLFFLFSTVEMLQKRDSINIYEAILQAFASLNTTK